MARTLCGSGASQQYEESILGKRYVQEKEEKIGMDSEKQLRKREKVEENSQKKYSGGDDESPLPSKMRLLSWNCQGLGNPLDSL